MCHHLYRSVSGFRQLSFNFVVSVAYSDFTYYDIIALTPRFDLLFIRVASN